MKRKGFIVTGIFILILASAILVIYNSSLSPVNNADESQVFIRIPPGYGTSQIAALLQSEKIIKNPTAFKLYSRLHGLDGKMKEGEYHLSPSMSVSEITETIVKGKVIQYFFTIPEGYTVKQIAKRLAQKDFVDEDSFLAVARNEQFDIPFEYQKPLLIEPLEGYLFPDTYSYVVGMDERDIISMMVENFNDNIESDMIARASDLGYSMQEVLTIASMIEREARLPNERKTVASVIYNRLEVNMRLQLCATVQYLLPEQKDVLLYSDLEIESPYNTYKYQGLPPGPISNPGIESIKAALYPEETPYFYFVAKNDGSHVFSVTLAEHNRAIEEIQGK